MNRYEGSPAIVIERRKGTPDSPFSDMNESLVVASDGKVVLTEIPNELNRVIVTSDDNTTWYEITNGQIPLNGFKVDYINKVVTFNIANVGKQLHFKYFGEGNHYYSLHSIYTKLDEGDVVETLGDLIENGTDALDALGKLDQKLDEVNQATTNAITATNETREVISEGNQIINIANTKITEIDGKINEATTKISELNVELDEARYTISDVQQKSSIVDGIITDGQDVINKAQLVIDEVKSVGNFNLTTYYKKNNTVLDKGSTWVALQDTQNNPLPVLPVTENTYWRLTALHGAKGDKGDTGAALSVLGKFTDPSQLPPTGQAGQAYTVNGELYVWSENLDAWENVGNIKGEKGEKGDTGEDGLSAYEVAVNNGFVGTIEEWLTSLKGEKGDKGQDADLTEVNQEITNLQQAVTDHSTQFKKLKNKATVNFLNVQQLNQVRHFSPKPMLVIEYDDGAIEDYTLALPIHKKYKVPATTNIITQLIGAEDQQGNTYMTKEQLIELYDNGWEISNHTARHNNLGEERLLVSANIGDIKIYPSNANAFRPDIGGATNGIIIEDSIEEVVTFVSNGNDASGDYLIIESPLQNNFTTSAKFRLTDDELLYEILGAQTELEKIGVDPNGIAYPYGNISPLSRKIVASSHNAGRHIGKDGDSVNAGINDVRVKPLKTYGLYSSEFSLLTNEEISNALNEALLVNGLCIMYAHPYNSNFDVSKLEFLIQQAQSLGIDIVTRSEALLHFGNLIEIGDFIEEINNPYPSFLVVGQNREVYSGTMNVGNGENLTFFTANNSPYIQGRNANLNIGSSNLSDLVLRTGDGTPFGSIETVRLRHQTNDIELSRSGGGIVFTSPNGAIKKKLTIDNSGTPVWVDV